MNLDFAFISNQRENFGGSSENARVLQYYKSDEIEASRSQQDTSQPSFSLSSIKKKPRPTAQEFVDPKVDTCTRNSSKTNPIAVKSKPEKLESDDEPFFENEVSLNFLTKKQQVKEVLETGLEVPVIENNLRFGPPKPKSKSKPMFGSLRIDIEEANKTEETKVLHSGPKETVQTKEPVPEIKTTETLVGIDIVKGFFNDQMNKLTEKNESLLRENERIKLELEVLQKKKEEEEDLKRLFEELGSRYTLLEDKLAVKEQELIQANQIAIKKEIEIAKLKAACEALEQAQNHKQETSLGILSKIHDYRLQAYKNMKSNRSKTKFSDSCQSQEPNIHFHVT